MKPFRSPQEMLDAHEQMFGEAGRQCAEIVLRQAGKLFAVPLDALNIRVVLAPVELGPYNRHYGYHYGPTDKGIFILGNKELRFSVPSCLVECGFMRQEYVFDGDEKHICDPEVQDLYAASLARGLANYFGIPDARGQTSMTPRMSSEL